MSGNTNRFRKGKMMIAALIMAVSSLFISTSATAESGGELYNNFCASCHKLSSARTVGPGLAGINERRSEEWLISWIKNSGELIASGDPDAIAIFEEYKKMPMTAFTQFSDDDIKGILGYIAEETAAKAAGGGGDAVASAGGAGDETVVVSDSQKSIIFWGILLVILVTLYFFTLKRKVEKLTMEKGLFPEPYATKNYPAIFVGLLFIAAAIVYALTLGLENNLGKINGMMFGALPYVAIAIFLVGSIYRYTKSGYKVSSLSSQFMEGKKLFWGSQPFHWGLLVLFFGHLIAFLFPSAVLAWNGEPVRLLILEISSFAFAILALMGLVLLIKRRLNSKLLLVVTNKMDMIVYTVLFTQIISGIGVAFFVRWGSSWFASVLTPYLRSVFSFNPDYTAVAEAPVLVQIHIISAFVLIALIPFTRFMHFLVAPIDYLFRRYQVVMWNWNRRTIRKSTRHFFGRKPRNH